ncbi:response regulator transcription factor [Phenylobacterium sp. J367]|uniref:response regulator transcription factor n=1 Tax=Phenylobacterium sp. J367 TaxID=2898435 RepID=UPI002151BE48|nr:helix-turn-helix transcriptional regulator [Phenylobacterium sp. J367]MCR5879672.1 helix-turn-helix transcriptional regulator [Phenylobacterium sp. J367]
MHAPSEQRPEEFGDDLTADRVTLSPRQTQCLFWVQQGKSSRDIGTILGISHRIVERHVFRACHKLGVRTRIQAVIRARELGLVEAPARTGSLTRFS